MFFRKEKKLGDTLIVALNSDRSVRTLKGPPRPIVPQAERAEIIAALACVDFVTIFDQDDPLENHFRSKNLTFWFKGGDWALNTIVGRDIVESYGGQVIALPLVPRSFNYTNH